jgi:hypothetical protein
VRHCCLMRTASSDLLSLPLHVRRLDHVEVARVALSIVVAARQFAVRAAAWHALLVPLGCRDACGGVQGEASSRLLGVELLCRKRPTSAACPLDRHYVLAVADNLAGTVWLSLFARFV